MFIIIYLFFSLIYLLMIVWFIIGFTKCEKSSNLQVEAKKNFSILIPFRNEEANLKTLLNSLLELHYPKSKFELLFIDDDSSDHSKAIIEEWQLKNASISLTILNNVRLSNSPKKDALTIAITKAKFDWIVTTDADCVIPKNWLAMFNQTILNRTPYFIAAPVKFSSTTSFLHQFQNFNLLSLIGSTIGAFGVSKPFMCNGANLCYSKEIFKTLNGFEKNSNIASGDDIFILEKIVNSYPKKAIYLKSEEAIVETKSEPNWTSFFQQQLRWASKTSAYTNRLTKSIGIVVFIQNLLLVISGIWAIKNLDYLTYFAIIFTLKLIVDFVLIKKTAHFLKSKLNFLNYCFTSILYPFFIIYIGLLSLFRNYEWKGRTFKR